MTAHAPPPLSLTILRQGERLFVDLAETGTLIPRGETRVEDAFLQEVAEELRLLATPGFGQSEAREGRETVRTGPMLTPGVERSTLEHLGELLFSHLLPEAAQVRLRTAVPGDLYLRLDEQLVHLPWELCYDGEQFLAMKFRMGRQVITSAPVRSMNPARQERHPLRVLLIADPTETLPQAGAEADRLCHFFSGIPEVVVTLLGGHELRKAPLLAALQSHDLVHFAGHSQYDSRIPSASGWQLREGLVTVEELGRLAHPPLLVFSNSCQAGATVAWEANSHYDEHAFGIGSAFLLAGVKNYIGTFWIAHDEESAVFATAFYHSLTAGQSLGEALSQARQTILAQRGWYGLTWASYMLYGDPALTVLPSTHVHPLASASLTTASQRAQVLQRKLAAILSADVKGYSRLMGDDEEATIRTLTAYREVMTVLIQQHHGRVVDAPGDNLLAEFASAVDAVQGAVEIQKTLKIKNAELPPNRQMEFRIGINVGDVLVEGERLYGDGVNIAARLEALADGGGICILGTVYDQVESKLSLKYENLGEQTVKNITKPVRVYQIQVDESASQKSSSQEEETQKIKIEDHALFSSSQPLVPNPHRPAPNMVGRETELSQLQRWLEKALHGERQVVFVTGEPGIGKTTLIEVFLSRVRSPESQEEKQRAKGGSSFLTPNSQPSTLGVRIGWGQCIEQYGAGEAYMPVLSTLGQLCREPEGQCLVEILSKYAPTWLVQMPALLNATDFEALQRKTKGATKERMLREMAEAVEALTAERPLVLWLEDLHWSDYSTLDLIAFLARRRQRARLLVIGTSRSVEGTEHPLRTVKQELQLHGQCAELAVRLLSEAHITQYLAVRWEEKPSRDREGAEQRPLADARGSDALRTMARLIHQRTEGNPLFMVNVVDELLAREKLDDATVEISVPTNIRQLIEQQLERLSAEEQRMLAVASVAGMEFSAAALAAGAETTVDEVEQQCAVLVRRGQFLRAAGTADWPDGTVASRYGFIHALYQEVVYERIPAGRRAQVHKQIGSREEQAYGNRAKEIAAELAVHFEQGRDYQRTVLHLRRAAQNALRRSAHQEAVSLLTKGLEFLRTLPGAAEDIQQELRMQLTLGTALIALKGFGAPEVEKAYARAYDLCQQAGEAAWLFPALGGLYAFYQERGELKTARNLAEQLLALAQREHNPVRLVWAYCGLGEILRYTGDLLLSRTHLEQSLTFYTPQPDHSYGFVYNPQVLCLSTSVLVLYQLGYSEQALQRSKQALTVAQELAQPYSLVIALNFAALVHRLRGELRTAYKFEEAKTALAREEGFAYYVANGMTMRGWYLVEQGQGEEGIQQMRRGLTDFLDTGANLARPGLLALLAEAYGKVGQAEEGLQTVAKALEGTEETGAHIYDANLYKIKGELTLQQRNQKIKGKGQKAKITDPQVEAEACFLKAIDIAHQQQAKSWELRATISLARLWQQQGKHYAARNTLSEIYNWFTEGFDTKDLKEAKVLLAELTK